MSASPETRSRRALEAQARDELDWFFNYAEGDACNLVAAHYRFLSTVGEGSAEIDEKGFVRTLGSDLRSGPRLGHTAKDDLYSDDRSFARQRLRSVWTAFTSTPRHAQATLEAFFLRSPVKEFRTIEPEWLAVAATLEEVQVEAQRQRVTRLEAARKVVVRDGANAVRGRCREVLDAAFDAFVAERFPHLRLRVAS